MYSINSNKKRIKSYRSRSSSCSKKRRLFNSRYSNSRIIIVILSSWRLIINNYDSNCSSISPIVLINNSYSSNCNRCGRLIVFFKSNCEVNLNFNNKTRKSKSWNMKFHSNNWNKSWKIIEKFYYKKNKKMNICSKKF